MMADLCFLSLALPPDDLRNLLRRSCPKQIILQARPDNSPASWLLYHSTRTSRPAMYDRVSADPCAILFAAIDRSFSFRRLP